VAALSGGSSVSQPAHRAQWRKSTSYLGLIDITYGIKINIAPIL